MKSECTLQLNGCQLISSTSQSVQSLYYNVSSFLLNNSKGDLYKVLQGLTWFQYKLGAKSISRSALARFAKCHKDTVSEINMRLEEAGIFQIERGYKQINRYRTSLLKVLAIIFGYASKCWLSSTSLLDLKLMYNHSNISMEKKNQVFKTEQVSKKGEYVGKIVFSPKTGFYCPLELRPFNGTIEIPYADSSQSIGRSINYLFPDYEKIAIYEAQKANADRLAKESLAISREMEPIYKREHSPEQITKFLDSLK